MIDFQKNFLKEYQKLNPEQKKAVDTIDGPVMVLAGPGTGKTQTIALRIANILQKTDTPTSSILCLTFTDNASLNMRQRLETLIGPLSYSVQIDTFHSFCNKIIKSNPDRFSLTDLKSIEDIDKIPILKSLVKKLPIDSPLHPRHDQDAFIKDIISAISSLKRESISSKKFTKIITQNQIFLKSIKTDYQSLKALRFSKTLEDDLLPIFKNILSSSSIPAYYKRLLSQKYQHYRSGLYTTGPAKNPIVNFKNDIISCLDNLTSNFDKYFQLSFIYQKYQRQLKKSNLYDFDDMINFIITAFKSDSDFLVSYQEQIQYILVDEFQDSNNSQVQLLSLLSSYFDRPNLFVVGDDDQSIFRFQGASVQNLYDFYQKYQVKPIILTQNYRSHQLVLDASKSLIDKSSQSLSKLISNIDKNLTAQPDLATSPIKLFKCPNPISEAQYISSQIKALMDRGVSANSIAVLYRHHKDTQYLTKFLNVQKIKFNQSKTNCLLEDHLNFFIRLLKAISDPFNNTNLYSALSLPISGISSQRLIRLIFKLRRDNADLSTYLFSQKIKSKTISSFVKKISDCRVGQENINLDSLFIYIINTFSYLDYLSGLSNNFTAISDLNALFSYLKTFIDNNPQAQLKDFVARLDLLLQYNLSIPQIELTPPQDCLNLLTIHGAKGLEFDHVFVLNCLAKNWENYRFPQKLSLPDGIVNKISQSDQIEEERRLFFVALTRAKKQIYLSYSNSDLNQKSQTPSQFILDIDQKYINAQTISTQLSISDLAINLSPDRIDLPDQNRHYLTTYLKNHYKFNISHLNSYLRCPHCFYFKNILKIPLVKNDSLVFGTAVHASLAHLHKNHQADLNKAIDIFQNSLKNHKFDNNKYDYYLEKGQKAIKNYFDHGFDPKAEYKSEVDFGMENIHIDAVPVTGKIDKIQILTTSTNTKTNILISDFKTGKPDNISAKLKPGFDSYHGNYFRQILFYQLLLDLSPRYKNYHLKTAQLEFLEPKKNGQYLPPQIISYTKPDLEKLKQLISQVYQNILELKFPINYTCRDPDHLHHLT